MRFLNYRRMINFLGLKDEIEPNLLLHQIRAKERPSLVSTLSAYND